MIIHDIVQMPEKMIATVSLPLADLFAGESDPTEIFEKRPSWARGLVSFRIGMRQAEIASTIARDGAIWAPRIRGPISIADGNVSFTFSTSLAPVPDASFCDEISEDLD